ncbi:MAG: hypothetical protein U0103_29285 [Candidatus Obscuribacterales bacterium]
MIDQDTWVSFRLLYLRQGKSKSWLAREFGISRNTVAKYLANPDALRYRTVKPRGKPILSKWEWLVIRRSSPGEEPELRGSPVPKRPSPDSGTNASILNSPGAEDEI